MQIGPSGGQSLRFGIDGNPIVGQGSSISTVRIIYQRRPATCCLFVVQLGNLSFRFLSVGVQLIPPSLDPPYELRAAEQVSNEVGALNGGHV